MNMTEITAQTMACIEKARTLYDLSDMPTPVSRALKSRRALGMCRYRPSTRQVFLEFNLTIAAEMGEDFAHVIPHEVAHMVAVITGSAKGHDWRWGNICRALGGDAKRTCAIPDSARLALTEVAGQRRTRYYVWFNAFNETFSHLDAKAHARMIRAKNQGFCNLDQFTNRMVLSAGNPDHIAAMKSRVAQAA